MERGSASSSAFLLMVAAGVAAGAAAAVTATAFPYLLGVTVSAIRSKRRREHKEQKYRQKEKARKPSGAGGSKEGQAYRDAVARCLTSWQDIDCSFESFPYWLSDVTKLSLLDAVYIHLRRPDFAKYTVELASISPRILLTGPPGSEIFQEALVKALARHLQAKLLVFDSTQICLEASNSHAPSAVRGEDVQSAPVDAAADCLPVVEEVPAETLEHPERGRFSKGSAGAGAGAAMQAPGLASTSATAVHAASLGAAATGPGFTGRLVTRPQGVRMEQSSVASSSSFVGQNGEEGQPPASLAAGGSSRARSKKADALPPAPPEAKLAPPPPKAAAPPAEANRALKKGDRVRYGGPSTPGGLAAASQPAGGPPIGLKGRVLMVLEDNPNKVGVRFDKPIFGGNNLVDLCEEGHGFFCNVADLRLEGSQVEDSDKLVMEALFEVLRTEAAREPLIVFLKNTERTVVGNFERYMRLERFEKTDARLVVVGSHTAEPRKEKATGAAPPRAGNGLTALLDLSLFDQLTARMDEFKGDLPKASKMLAKIFPTRITIQPPQDDAVLREWNAQLEADAESLKAESNRQRLRAVMTAANVVCDELPEVSITNQLLTPEGAERIVAWGASHLLQEHQQPSIKGGKLEIDLPSLRHSIGIVQAAAQSGNGARKSLKDIVTDNEFEKMLLSEVIPPDELNVTFDHIGALDHVKETLRELVMLPLQRPELFVKGQLTKPVRGLLLFGPPGTGKTMLAKAVATESGANFINVSMSTIASKWFGEAEKYVKAVFTLASKTAPSVIFIDEVDSMLGRRGKENEHSAMRKVKNELMSSWDGLRTRERERVLVLAATNRPFDLDEAVIRRFPRRIMIDLPDAGNRAKILKVILAEEDLSPEFNIEELASSTDGYSGSDLRNLCTTAAYRRIREILDKEKKEKEKAKAEGKEVAPPDSSTTPFIRPLSMEDMKQAMEKVRSSVSTDAASMLELTEWNEQYGEGGTRKHTPLSYFM